MRSRSIAHAAFVALASWLCASGASAASPQAGGEIVAAYRVRPGDNLYQLARDYCLHLADYRVVQAVNRVAQPRRLRVGRTLRVPVRLLRTEPMAATVDTFSGQVTRTTGGATVKLAKGLAIREGDEIETGVNSFARLALPDGSHVALPSNSRFAVQTLRRTLLTGSVDRVFLLKGGRSESVVTPMTRPGDRFVIRTPLSIAAVRGTDFRVSFDPGAGRSNVEVVRGKVSVSATGAAAQAQALVALGAGAVVTAAGVSDTVRLLPEPALRSADRVQDGEHVTFDIEPLAGAASYRAVIAQDANLLNPILETEAAAPGVDVGALDDGEWFVRLTAVGADGLEGEPRTYGFERVRNGARLGEPTELRDQRTRRWLFRWEAEGAGRRQFRFQLSRANTDAPPVIDEAGLTDGQITVTNLEPGLYTWRVRSTLVYGDRLYETWSRPREFRIGA